MAERQGRRTYLLVTKDACLQIPDLTYMQGAGP